MFDHYYPSEMIHCACLMFQKRRLTGSVSCSRSFKSTRLLLTLITGTTTGTRKSRRCFRRMSEPEAMFSHWLCHGRSSWRTKQTSHFQETSGRLFHQGQWLLKKLCLALLRINKENHMLMFRESLTFRRRFVRVAYIFLHSWSVPNRKTDCQYVKVCDRWLMCSAKLQCKLTILGICY